MATTILTSAGNCPHNEQTKTKNKNLMYEQETVMHFFFKSYRYLMESSELVIFPNGLAITSRAEHDFNSMGHRRGCVLDNSMKKYRG